MPRIIIISAGAAYLFYCAKTDLSFRSAAYIAGRFSLCGNTVEFKPATEMILFRSFKHHKVEALELAGGIDGIVFATDDEDFGSSITFSDLPGILAE